MHAMRETVPAAWRMTRDDRAAAHRCGDLVPLVEAGDESEIVVVTMGPDIARAAILKSLQMGADSGVHVVDEAIHGSDAVGTSLVLAKVIEQQQ